MGNKVMYDRSAWFLRVIMSSSLALCCLPLIKKKKHDFNIIFCRSMYNKNIVRFEFCDIQIDRNLGKGYQPRPLPSADNHFLDKHLIQ